MAISYLTVELLGAEPVMEFVYEDRLAQEREGKTKQVFDISMRVKQGAFVVGKEPRDILWPPECVVLGTRHNKLGHHSHLGHTSMYVGDVLKLHFVTYDPDTTFAVLYDLIGEQTEEDLKIDIDDQTETDMDIDADVDIDSGKS